MYYINTSKNLCFLGSQCPENQHLTCLKLSSHAGVCPGRLIAIDFYQEHNASEF